ncbi:hypothetical protein CI610_02739 [invertebrate metagenome]|uniref:Uncharacterized protein n=1 Tax=invertebrate metagenome TaxID=1711999 RepID=A0A2H9T528_9ZZZZ
MKIIPMAAVVLQFLLCLAILSEGCLAEASGIADHLQFVGMDLEGKNTSNLPMTKSQGGTGLLRNWLLLLSQGDDDV